MIPQTFIQDLLNRLDIVGVIEHHVPLKRAGANYVACCPFHSEKTPSFTVSPAKQFYHCFGCGAHGTAIGFVMEYGGLGFTEAVGDLAQSLGMAVPQAESPAPRRAESRADVAELMQRAAQYYKNQLKQSETAIAYLKQRGLSGEIAARFGLGYAPPGWQNLAAVFPEYAAAAMLETGLVIENDEGRRYDRFRDRIMFPIVSERGAIIGFGGRVLGAGEPKYLNSPETALFEKGRELYGLYQARKAIRQHGKAVVVEGYMDVVALAQHGVEFAVATLGTATTPYHVQKLLRHTDEVVFCFDGDAAGRRAAWRALENSLAQVSDGKRMGFLFLPQGEDPDSYIRKHGREAFLALFGEALPLSSFLLRELTAQADTHTQEGRAKLLQDARPLVAQIAAPVLSLMLRKRLAELAGISLGELDGLYQLKPPEKRRMVQKAGRKAVATNRRTVLQCVVFNPALAARCDLPRTGAPQPEDGVLAELLEFLRSNPHVTTTAGLIQHFSGTPREALLSAIEREILLWGENFDVQAHLQGALEQIHSGERKMAAEALLNRASVANLGAEEKEQVRRLLQRPPGIVPGK